MKKTTIIIPTCGKGNIKKCIESIYQYTDMDSINLIINSNGSNNETNIYLDSLKKCKILKFSEPQGYPKAINECLNYVLNNEFTEYVILLNDDIVLLDQEKNYWINKLYQAFDDDKLVRIAGPHTSFCPHANEYNIVFHTVMIQTNLFKELGLLDESFGYGSGEDTDLCVKAINKGYKIKCVSESIFKNEQGMMVASFPIYHESGKTVNITGDRQQTLKTNSKILYDRYNKMNSIKRIAIVTDIVESPIQYRFKYKRFFDEDVFKNRTQFIYVNNSESVYSNTDYSIYLNTKKENSNISDRLYTGIRSSVLETNCEYTLITNSSFDRELFEKMYKIISEDDTVAIVSEYMKKLHCYSFPISFFGLNNNILIKNELLKGYFLDKDLTKSYDFNNELGIDLSFFSLLSGKKIKSVKTNNFYEIDNTDLFNSLLKLMNKLNMPVKINFSCGPMALNGYINTDFAIKSSNNEFVAGLADFEVDLTKIELINNSVDLINTSHVIEHFSKENAEYMIKRFYELLKNNGEVISELPDIKGACKRYLNAKDNDFEEKYKTLMVIFGLELFTCHKWGWDRTTLEALLRNVGFKTIRHEYPVGHHEKPALRIVAKKTE